MDNSVTMDKGYTSFEQVPSLVEKQVIDTHGKNESLLQQLTNNKLYIYIIIAIVILAFIGYYLYNTYFSKKSNFQNINSDKKDLDDKKHFLSPDTEYYLLDRSGNPILMNQHFNNFLHIQPDLRNNKLVQESSSNHASSNNHALSNHPELSKQHISYKQRPKLSHPNEDLAIDVNITENEDENIATQDLTHDEIEELKKQLDLMERKQSAPITAQNDEDGNEANF